MVRLTKVEVRSSDNGGAAMTIQNEHELDITRRKLTALEQQLVAAKDRLDVGMPLSDWTLRSLRKLIQQLCEEIIRFEAHEAEALRY